MFPPLRFRCRGAVLYYHSIDIYIITASIFTGN